MVVSCDPKARQLGLAREPLLHGHVRQGILELGAAVTAYPIGSTTDRKYPAQIVVMTAKEEIKSRYHAVHKPSFPRPSLTH